MHPEWLSNAYLVADDEGGSAVFVDSGADVKPLLAAAERWRVEPGHTDETTIGREWEQNPFVVVWRGAQREGTERVSVAGDDATLIVWSPDFDGGAKAWVRYDDGRDAIVGGSRVERG